MKTPVHDTVSRAVRRAGGGQRGIDRGNTEPANRRYTSVFRHSASNRTMQFCHYRGRQANRNSIAAEGRDFKIKPYKCQAGFFSRIIPLAPQLSASQKTKLNTA